MADLFANFEGVVSPGTREAEILGCLDIEKMPRHVAIIMDGNGRWAKQRGLRRVEGHRAGIDSVKAAVEYSARLQVANLTLYAFSAENWKRPADEVNTLWTLLRTYLRRELTTLQKHNICFRAIGRTQNLPESVQEELDKAQEKTRSNTMMNLVIALNYSGRLELVDAVNSLLLEGVKEPITESEISQHLYTAGLPDPDLLIRTSGEMRVSNFLLWQIAYSEILVSEVLWPDFRGQCYLEAILEFQRRERRYGGINSPSYQSTQ